MRTEVESCQVSSLPQQRAQKPAQTRPFFRSWFDNSNSKGKNNSRDDDDDEVSRCREYRDDRWGAGDVLLLPGSRRPMLTQLNREALSTVVGADEAAAAAAAPGEQRGGPAEGRAGGVRAPPLQRGGGPRAGARGAAVSDRVSQAATSCLYVDGLTAVGDTVSTLAPRSSHYVPGMTLILGAAGGRARAPRSGAQRVRRQGSIFRGWRFARGTAAAGGGNQSGSRVGGGLEGPSDDEASSARRRHRADRNDGSVGNRENSRNNLSSKLAPPSTGSAKSKRHHLLPSMSSVMMNMMARRAPRDAGSGAKHGDGGASTVEGQERKVFMWWLLGVLGERHHSYLRLRRGQSCGGRLALLGGNTPSSDSPLLGNAAGSKLEADRGRMERQPAKPTMTPMYSFMASHAEDPEFVEVCIEA
eukprot:GHVU01129637.1.p1 GENE.GHVU01129637.1~~GHVU01129637.1.p1  ORF type:complete len:454 (+),score=64.87 GHVU01129637.1:118-1362(+)